MGLINNMDDGIEVNVGQAQSAVGTLKAILVRKSTCPRCQDVVTRVKRRYVDRLMSIAIRVHRYQCMSPVCGWRGNMLVHHQKGCKLPHE